MCANDCPTIEMEKQEKGSSKYFPSFYYYPKASRDEREAGLGDLAASSREDVTGRKPDSAGQQHARSGMTARGDIRNIHPTVKPIGLMRFLCRLVTPPGGTVLDPFNGSGTTGCGATMEDLNYFGIELSDDFANIARERIKYWAERRPCGVSPSEATGSSVQLGLFANEAEI